MKSKVKNVGRAGYDYESCHYCNQTFSYRGHRAVCEKRQAVLKQQADAKAAERAFLKQEEQLAKREERARLAQERDLKRVFKERT